MRDGPGAPGRRWAPLSIAVRFKVPATGAVLLLAGLGAAVEMHTSLLQSLLFSWRADGMTYVLRAGASGQAQFPHSGPYDARLGYEQLSQFIQALTLRGFVIEQQAHVSPAMERFIATGGYAIYREKSRAGLTLLGRDGKPLFSRQYPRRAFVDYPAVPPLVVQMLLFLEDRHLLDEDAHRNPAIEWQRFVLALGGRLAGLISPELRQGGASTLATQIEKVRHYPGGLTRGVGDKLGQMTAASLRAYLDGRDTRDTRRQIVATYLDSTPLASRADYGEVIGIGDGLWAWYGTELAEARAALAPAADPRDIVRAAEIYKQVLSLLLAQRRPAYYLMTAPGRLRERTDQYLRLLQRAGLISQELAGAALPLPLRFLPAAPLPDYEVAPGRKAGGALRVELLTQLHVPSLSALDRLDLTVQSTLDADAQSRVSGVLGHLDERQYVRRLGLVGKDLLGDDRLDRVVYSVALYERRGDRNVLRVRADNLDNPFDVNSGTKLILGSTAKLRTLITYLDVMAELHARLSSLPPAALATIAAQELDPLSRWAAGWFALAGDRSLRRLLDAAMQRRYSANPYETFFTGGGGHVFHNFRDHENSENPTVEEAFRLSINLSFVRLMRDLVAWHVARTGIDVKAMLEGSDVFARQVYLARFADHEGRVFLGRYFQDYRGLSSGQALEQLAQRVGPYAVPLAVTFRSVRPQQSAAEFAAFLARALPGRPLSERALQKLYDDYAPERYSLADRGYLAGVHPLELWLVGHLQAHPGAGRGELMRASASERQSAYRWLFSTRGASQNLRIRTILEEDAFEAILDDWRRQGFPFSRLVPSLATAIGTSGDRPDALANLMGIILNDGVQLANTDIATLRFAEGTPYETHLAWQPAAPRRVLLPEVAATVRRALEDVVESGTGQRLRGAYRGANCELLHVGGKTGTSDERFRTFGANRRVTYERPVNRAATFVFFLGQRFFGTITAYVPGPDSSQFHFTSSFVVQLLRAIAPELRDLLEGGATPVAACASEAK